jgi:hypothetical protein
MDRSSRIGLGAIVVGASVWIAGQYGVLDRLTRGDRIHDFVVRGGWSAVRVEVFAERITGLAAPGAFVLCTVAEPSELKGTEILYRRVADPDSPVNVAEADQQRACVYSSQWIILSIDGGKSWTAVDVFDPDVRDAIDGWVPQVVSAQLDERDRLTVELTAYEPLKVEDRKTWGRPDEIVSLTIQSDDLGTSWVRVK